MKTKLISIILLMVITMGISAMTDDEFLQFVRDDGRFALLFKSFISFEVFTPGGEPSTSEFVVYENRGKSVAIYLSPARDKGKVVLQSDRRYWMYFPRSKSVTILSPMASVSGNASSADILRPPRSSLYDITLLDVANKYGSDRVIQLIANTREAPYGKIVNYYSGTKALFAEFYSRSGIVLKTAEYEEHRQNTDNPGWIPMKTTITDGNNPEEYTIITFDELKIIKSVDQGWFNPNNLGRVRP